MVGDAEPEDRGTTGCKVTLHWTWALVVGMRSVCRLRIEQGMVKTL